MLRKEIKTPFNADSVEVSPDRAAAFVGMYEYEESTSSRGGGFLITDSAGNIKHEQTAEFGCLDAKWISNDCLAIACSDGIVRWFSCTDLDMRDQTSVVDVPSSTDTSNIIMTIDVENDTTACITAKGKLSILKDRSHVLTWEAHSPVFESWCCALNPAGNMVVSGSDDCSLKYWDVRSSELVFDDKRSHKMGTTSIEFLNDSTLLSGSYDEHIREFDIRNLSSPLREFKSVGGIWRIKPFQDLLYVAACYGGCQIIRYSDFKPVVYQYKGHDSMAYGIGALNEREVMSCSFYDKSLQIWAF